MTKESEGVKRSPWVAMKLRHVGDVGLVMTRKSGTKHDPAHHQGYKKRSFFH